MKLSIIGLGQCGSNIADAFYAVNSYAKSGLNRHIEILTDAFAINTDEADLGGCRNIPKDNNHRILIGATTTFGHGVGKINLAATEIIKSSNMEITDTILRSSKFHESDAVIAIAGGGGGTGSGTIGWLIKSLKERIDKPIYAVIILPFSFEEIGDTSFAIMNTATCLNTVSRYADAVFIVDNERFRKAGSSLTGTLHEVNKEIAGSFYDLCCAGEEKEQKYIGGKVIDAGDIKQSLEGISIISKAKINLPVFKFGKGNYRDGIREQGTTLAALHQAEGNFGVSFKLEDARKILVLISAPKDVTTISTLEDISNFLQNKAPKAVIRIGDYPRRQSEISVTIVASLLTHVDRVENLFKKADDLFKKRKEIAAENEAKIEHMQEFSKNLPVLE